MRQRLLLTMWFVLLVAFVALGTRTIAKRWERGVPKMGDRFAATDESLRKLLHVEHGSQSLLQLAARMRADQSALVVGPGDSAQMAELQFIISYLLWPHRVWALGKTEDGSISRTTNLPKVPLEPALIFLYALKPTPDLAGKTVPFGENMTLIAPMENHP